MPLSHDYLRSVSVVIAFANSRKTPAEARLFTAAMYRFFKKVRAFEDEQQDTEPDLLPLEEVTNQAIQQLASVSLRHKPAVELLLHLCDHYSDDPDDGPHQQVSAAFQAYLSSNAARRCLQVDENGTASDVVRMLVESATEAMEGCGWAPWVARDAVGALGKAAESYLVEALPETPVRYSEVCKDEVADWPAYESEIRNDFPLQALAAIETERDTLQRVLEVLWDRIGFLEHARSNAWDYWDNWLSFVELMDVAVYAMASCGKKALPHLRYYLRSDDPELPACCSNPFFKMSVIRAVLAIDPLIEKTNRDTANITAGYVSTFLKQEHELIKQFDGECDDCIGLEDSHGKEYAYSTLEGLAAGTLQADKKYRNDWSTPESWSLPAKCIEDLKTVRAELVHPEPRLDRLIGSKPF